MEITIEYCSHYKAYNGAMLKEGQVLAPILFTKEMINSDDTVIRDNLRTWKIHNVKFTVGFIPIAAEDFEKLLSIFYSQINQYFEDHPELRPGRCVLKNDKSGYPILCSKDHRCTGCPHRYEDLPRFKSRADFIQNVSLDSEVCDENGNNVKLEIPDPNTSTEDEAMESLLLIELLDTLDKTDHRYSQIATLGLQDYTKEQIIEKLGLKPSRGYQEIKTAKDLSHKFLD